MTQVVARLNMTAWRVRTQLEGAFKIELEKAVIADLVKELDDKDAEIKKLKKAVEYRDDKIVELEVEIDALKN